MWRGWLRAGGGWLGVLGNSFGDGVVCKVGVHEEEARVSRARHVRMYYCTSPWLAS